jgi:phosphoglycolate phosphatase
MSYFQAVLLDLDGTLLDTIPDLSFAANAMRLELGMPALAQELIATFVGKGVDNLVQRSLASSLDVSLADMALFPKAREIFHTHYHRVNGEHSVMFEGVLPGLELMRANDLKLAVVTNKPTEFTLPLLERTGLAPLLQTVVCGDTLSKRKPDPAPMRYACEQLSVLPKYAVAVGDSLNDALSAKAAGCAVLAVPYGYNEGMDVQALEVDAIVDSIVQAAQWIVAHTSRDE